MSEFEVVELSIGLGANAISSFTIFISVTFAYLTLCHFVGAKLTKFQTIAVSIVFLVGASSPAVSAYGYLVAQGKLQSKYPSLIDTVAATNIDVWLIWQPIMVLLILVMSLYFMYEIRTTST